MLNKTNIELMKIKTALRLSKEVLQDKSKEYLTYAGIPIIECPYLDEDEGMIVFKDSSWDIFVFQSKNYKKFRMTLDSVTHSSKISRILVTPHAMSQIEILRSNPFNRVITPL